MKKLSSIFPLLLFAVFSIQAQPPSLAWLRSFGSSEDVNGMFIQADPAGNIYTAGLFRGTIDFDPGPGESFLSSPIQPAVFMVKLDQQGHFLWAKAIGEAPGAGDIALRSCRLDASGNLLLTGNFNNQVDFDPGPGIFYLNSTQMNRPFALQLTPGGQFIDAWKITGPFDYSIFGVIADEAGNIYSAGSFIDTTDMDPGPGIQLCTSGGMNDIFLQKRDAAGELLWTVCLNGSALEVVMALLTDQEGNIYMTGNFSGIMDMDPGPEVFNLTGTGFLDAFILKLSPDGQFIWAKAISGPGNASGNQLALDSGGNLLLAGVFSGEADLDPGPGTFHVTSNGFNDVFLLKLDPNGNFLWAAGFGGPDFDNSHALTIDGQDNVYFAGNFQGTVDFDPGPGIAEKTAESGRDIFVLKLNDQGDFRWVGTVSGANNLSGDRMDLALNMPGHLYLTGSFRSTADFDPTDAGVFELTAQGLSDCFIAKWEQSTTGVKELDGLSGGLRIFPNPSRGAFSIFFDERVENIRISLLTSSGQLLQRHSFGPAREIQLEANVPPGLYFLKIEREEEVPRVVRVVVAL